MFESDGFPFQMSGEARALKVFRWMPPGADPVYLRREVETMRQLKHRHIVKFYGLEEEVVIHIDQFPIVIIAQ